MYPVRAYSMHIYLSVSISLPLPLPLLLPLPLPLPLSLSIYLSIYRSIYLYLCVYIYVHLYSRLKSHQQHVQAVTGRSALRNSPCGGNPRAEDASWHWRTSVRVSTKHASPVVMPLSYTTTRQLASIGLSFCNELVRTDCHFSHPPHALLVPGHSMRSLESGASTMLRTSRARVRIFR